MTSTALVQFWLVSFLIVATPGLDWAFAISAGLRGGVVVPAVAGLVLGHLTITLVVATGVGALVASAPIALALVTVTGSVYLLWLAVNMIARPTAPRANATTVGTGWRVWLAKGFAVSGMNPKVLLLLLALLPQFTDRHAAMSVSLQVLVLGAAHLVNCAVVYLLVGFMAGAVLKARPHAAVTMTRVAGIAMVFLAVGTLWSQLV